MSALRSSVLVSLCLLLGCPTTSTEPVEVPQEALIPGQPFALWPATSLTTPDTSTETGVRLNLPETRLPAGDTPLEVTLVNRRDGFSPVGPILLHLPEVDLTGLDLPAVGDQQAALEEGATVQLVELASGRRIPLWVELDAWPDAAPEQRALIARPLEPLAFGQRYALAIRSGRGLEAPAHFAALRDGLALPELAALEAPHEVLFTALEGAGLPRAELALAWDFPVVSEDSCHQPLDTALAASRRDNPADEAPELLLERELDADDGDELSPWLWRVAEGDLMLHQALDEDLRLVRDEAGTAVDQGPSEAYFVAAVPESVRDAEPGSVPVLVFGHGLLADPFNNYLGNPSDPSSVQRLVDELGVIAVATRWRGLSSADLVTALGVGADFGLFPRLTDQLTQAVGNVDAISRLMAGALAEHPLFAHPEGGSLIDTSRVHYYGISLGGIEGAVLMANSETIDYGVLHVPGAAWSTMLERSSNWTPFEVVMVESIPEPADRQLLYAVSQLLWDPVDPATHARDLIGRSVLLQEAIGDEQVPNFTTELLARGAELPLLAPSVTQPGGLELVSGPLPPGSAALSQFDPERAAPPLANRPAPVTDAHTTPRHWDATRAQIAAFFEEGREGTIIAPCGEAPCTETVADPAAP